MKAISFFKFFIFGILTLIFIVGLSGCGQKSDPKPKIKLKYIKRKCPNIVNLKPIPASYKPKEVQLPIEVYPADTTKFIVDKDKLKEASKESQKKTIVINKQSRYIKFYENQNRRLKKLCGQK